MSERRSTWQKAAVKEKLAEVNVFISAQDLHQQLARDQIKVGLTTVYRALAELAETPEVDALSTDDGETRYRICHTLAHHHHLSCRSCGKAIEVKFAASDGWADKLAAEHGFTNVTHSIEVFGICAACGE